MSVIKRNTGADIPQGYMYALERDGTVVGYAKNETEADNFIATTGNDQAARVFFEKKHGSKLFGRTADEVVNGAIGVDIAEETPAESRQHMRRIDRFRSIFDQFFVDRASVSHGPNIIHVTWEEFTSMHNEYKDAEKAGEHKNFPFQPLSAYAHKLIRVGKRPIRPILSNEVGVWTNRNGQAKVVILKDQGPGDMGEKYFQVPKGA